MARDVITHTGPTEGGNFEARWKGRYVDAHLLSDVGVKREHNEDSCLLCAPPATDEEEATGVLVAVADGMGGASAGEFASRLALQTLQQYFLNSAQAAIPSRLRAAVEEANARVFAEALEQPELEGMGTTMSAVYIKGPYAYVAHVGDSRIYLARPHAPVQQVTLDHSLVAEQLRNGIITEEEARNHAMKNLITRAVGTKPAVRVDTITVEIAKGDTLLICSDGLSNLVDEPVIQGIMSLPDLAAAARKLIEKAIEGGGPDNITAVLLRITDTPPAAPCESNGEILNLPRPSFWTRLRRLFQP